MTTADKVKMNRANAAAIELYLSALERCEGYDAAWDIRIGFERGEFTLKQKQQADRLKESSGKRKPGKKKKVPAKHR